MKTRKRTKPKNVTLSNPFTKSPKKAYYLTGGPWDGQTLMLAYTGDSLPISLSGWKGRYVSTSGTWQRVGTAKWEDAKC